MGLLSTKIGILGPKTMPKHFLNNSKTTLKKSENDFFEPQNGQKLPSQMSKVGYILTEKFEILRRGGGAGVGYFWVKF